MSKDIRRRMSHLHEEFIAQSLGTIANPGSGNRFNKPSDGRMDRHSQEFSFAFDCKATLGRSQSVSLDQWDKILRQSHHDRPLIPLRYYLDDRLTTVTDLAVIGWNDFKALLDIANGDQ